MKLKRRGILVVLVLSMIFGVGMMTSSSNQVAFAKTRRTMKTFPKSIRGTWYSYQDHKMSQIKITAKKFIVDGHVNRLHSRKVTYVVKNYANMKHPSWVTAGMMIHSNKERWVNVMGWYQSSGYGSSYRKATHKLNGHKRAILQMASGVEAWTDGHGYHSKHLAKKYGNHYFKGERKNL
ncbi:DUF4179 domain-containing protein [Levilactobacillus wangkuiensis]|uniref:DUF4179 domain-containing protein n=1 Tax=Levilactobacillus wangkuiensis TaxID=2799566 RepID=UPI0019404917|nr:DUF4179 domain-containing protein [Levilactobacillus wangkuiensis]